MAVSTAASNSLETRMHKIRRVRGDLNIQTVDEKGTKISHTLHIDAEKEHPLTECGAFIGGAIQDAIGKLAQLDALAELQAEADKLRSDLDKARSELREAKSQPKAPARAQPKPAPAKPKAAPAKAKTTTKMAE